MKITSQLRCLLVCQLTVSFPTLELRHKCFSYNDIFFMTFFCGTLALRMEVTLKLRFVFVCHCDVFLLRHNYVIYLFDVLTFFLRR